jgi:hypothetical protein
MSFVEGLTSGGGAAIVPAVVTATTRPSMIVWDCESLCSLGASRIPAWIPPSDRSVYLVLQVEDLSRVLDCSPVSQTHLSILLLLFWLTGFHIWLLEPLLFMRLSTIIYCCRPWNIIIILLLFVPWKIGTNSGHYRHVLIIWYQSSCLWEDAMEDFLWYRGLESHMKIFFAKRTFSKHVLQWWINLQQQHIARGGDPYQIWRGMKVMLQRWFDPPLKSKKKIAVACGTKWLDTKQDVRSSWNNFVIGEECLKKLRAQDVKILHP